LAGALSFQCKQLGWYTVINSFQHKQQGWCFILSVRTARLVHCSKLITAQHSSAGALSLQCKKLGWYNVVNSLQHKQLCWCFILAVQKAWLVQCGKLIAAQTARLVLYPFIANSSAGTL
jgi:hypothetical protein